MATGGSIDGSMAIEQSPSRAAATSAIARSAPVDLLRGLAMILMALDHARDFFSPFAYAPEDLSHASAGLFLTRWITHFCAPAFIFLAGTAAFLHSRKSGVARESLRRFLITRGLFLVSLELTVVSFLWLFHFTGLVIQVIWVIGWSMVFLALLLDLSVGTIAGIGAFLVVAHNLLDGWHVEDFVRYGAGWPWLWAILHEPHSSQVLPDYRVSVWYPLVPWIGVMALGYAFGSVLSRSPADRRRFLYVVGSGMLVLFFFLRLTNLYGEPRIWSSSTRGPLYSALDVLNVTKYPPSLCYLLLTLGLLILSFPLLDRWRGRLAQFVATFGRAPLLFYLLHLLVLHAVAAIWVRASHTAFGPDLLRAYVAAALIVVCLYPLCHAYGQYKARHKEQWWLSYL